MRLVGQSSPSSPANSHHREPPERRRHRRREPVTSAQPDGYTLFVLSSGIAISKSLLKTMPFIPSPTSRRFSTVAYFDLLILRQPPRPCARLTTDLRRAAPIPANSTSAPSIRQHAELSAELRNRRPAST